MNGFVDGAGFYFYSSQYLDTRKVAHVHCSDLMKSLFHFNVNK